jgi:hypothetical protein
VVLKVLGSVHMPRDAKTVQVFAGGEFFKSCDQDDEECIRRTPIGSRFKVAAQAMGDDEQPILLVRYWKREAVVPIATGERVADLAGSRYHYAPANLGAHFRNEADFELRKDLLRLERAKTEDQALEVLLRLAADPTLLDGAREDSESATDVFEALVQRHLKSPRSRQALQQRLRLVNYWKDQQSEAELAASGYLTARFIQAQGLLSDDDTESLRPLKEVAGKGFHPAMLALALEYQKRAEALEENPRLSADYNRQAADLFAKLRRVTRNAESEREASGIYLLSKFYHEGIGGLRADPEEATRLACIGRAAAQTDPSFPELIVQWAEMRTLCYGE